MNNGSERVPEFAAEPAGAVERAAFHVIEATIPGYQSDAAAIVRALAFAGLLATEPRAGEGEARLTADERARIVAASLDDDGWSDQ